MGCDLGDLADSKEISFTYLSNRVLAVDAYNTLYQFLSSIRGADGTPLMDSKGRLTGHLTGLFYRTVKWLEAGIKPVFIFDGKPPELKAKTLQERRERKEEAKKKMQKALDEGDIEDARKYAQQTSKLTPEMAKHAKSLLDAMGIPHIQAPSEGEAEAADLAKRKIAWCAASQDFDSLLFGSPLLLRNLSTTGRRKVPRKNTYIQIEPQLISLEDTLKKNELTQYQLIWLGILSGTDFNKGIHGIGPKKGLKLVAGAKSFKEVISRLPPSIKEKSEMDEISGLENWEEIEEFFLKPPVTGTQKIDFSTPNAGKITSLLCDEFDFSKERVERTLNAFEKKREESGGQTTLGDW
ncbi:flap endonuclease-1 [Candidatus Micrarchaeota archaeon CG10_big_fil_rev_8_21_14_0_10_45_29]|nr:MAG: flap endonuclease-1 [Candidatus Micrarchaeota archaeon CG10_big_fil_rev_8_21_14_0_10_45_29]